MKTYVARKVKGTSEHQDKIQFAEKAEWRKVDEIKEFLKHVVTKNNNYRCQVPLKQLNRIVHYMYIQQSKSTSVIKSH